MVRTVLLGLLLLCCGGRSGVDAAKVGASAAVVQQAGVPNPAADNVQSARCRVRCLALLKHVSEQKKVTSYLFTKLC